MSFKKGNLNVAAFRLSEKLNTENLDTYLETALQYRAKDLNAVSALDDPACGWVSGTVALDNNINIQNSHVGGYMYLNYRIAEKKINGELLKAHCERGEAVYLDVNQCEFVPSKVKREIKEDAARLLANEQATLCIKVIPVVARNDMMFVGATSQNDLDAVTALFFRTFGIEPVQISAATLNESDDFSEFTLGREFLTWLYWNQQEKAERKQVEFALNAPLDFIAPSDNDNGCTNAVTRGELAPIARESRTALREGKLLRKATLTVVSGDDIWEGVFDADKFTFSSLALPAAYGKNSLDEAFTERMELLENLFDLLANAFGEFIEDRKRDDYQNDFQEWINQY